MSGLVPQEDSRRFQALRVVALGLLLALALAGCGDGGGGGSSSHSGRGGDGGGGGGGGGGITYGTPPTCSGGDPPIIDNTSPDPTWTWNDPHVLKQGAEYWMYASSTVNFTFPVRTYRLTSTDAVTFARDPNTMPVLDVSATGNWDAGGIETPAVVEFGGEYHMFWTGYKDPCCSPPYGIDQFGIGHATSSNGVDWTRNPAAAPILTHSNLAEGYDGPSAWYNIVVGEPGPVVYNGQIYLYFTAAGATSAYPMGIQVIGLMTSSDGITWSAPMQVLSPDQALYPRDTVSGPAVGGWVGYSTPNAIVIGGQMHLFFDVAYDPDGTSWKQKRIHHARSPNGVTEWVLDSAPIYAAGVYSWNTEEVRSPHALQDGSTLRLYWAGHNASFNLAIAHSTCVMP